MLNSLNNIQQSYSVAFADYVRLKESEGKQIIKMQTGDPDFDTHPVIIEAAQKGLKEGATKYSDSRGLIELRNAIADKLLNENNINADPQTNILVTHGAVHAIGVSIRAIVNIGDECIIVEPYWRSYEANVLLSGGKPIFVKTLKEESFHLNADRVIQKTNSKTKLIIINTPNNPSGAVYEKDQLTKLAEYASQKGIFIISDEVYESIIFDNKKHFSMASNPSVFDWVISVFSFSKTHAMTGWRIGYLVASKQFVDEVLKLSQFSITSLSPYSQLGALKAINDNDSLAFSVKMRLEYMERRDFIIEKIKGTWLEKACTIPSGAFYLLIDVSVFNIPSLQLVKKLVDSANVSFTPGIAFGDSMDFYIRLCFATSLENISIAIESLIKFEDSYNY